ncbi:unnamed protein product, partial [Clonostachys chloroleuca]
MDDRILLRLPYVGSSLFNIIADIGVSSKLQEFLRGDVSLLNNLIPYTTIRSATFFVWSRPISKAGGTWLK